MFVSRTPAGRAGGHGPGPAAFAIRRDGRYNGRHRMKNVLEILTTTATFFADRGVESPRLNIEHLLAHVLGKRRMDLYLEFDRPVSERELEPLRDLVKRRARGEPLQHLLGTVEFHRREFKTDRRALIPRPETERFCELILELFPKAPPEDPSPPPSFLDVGTGSGVIALTLAGERPGARVVAVDASPDALALAGENARHLGLADRVEFARSDLLADAPPGPFDLVAANLPYVPAGELPGLAREVRDHDPALALDGGPDGLTLIERLIATAPPVLKPGGRLALEIGHGQAAQVVNLLLEGDYTDLRAEKDYQGVERYVFAARKG